MTGNLRGREEREGGRGDAGKQALSAGPGRGGLRITRSLYHEKKERRGRRCEHFRLWQVRKTALFERRKKKEKKGPGEGKKKSNEAPYCPILRKEKFPEGQCVWLGEEEVFRARFKGGKGERRRSAHVVAVPDLPQKEKEG